MEALGGRGIILELLTAEREQVRKTVMEEYQDGENSYCEFFGLVPFLQLAIHLTSALDGGECQHHAPAALYPPGKGPPVPIGQEAVWAPEPVWTQRLEEKSSACVGDRTQVVQSVVSHYTDWATPPRFRHIHKRNIHISDRKCYCKHPVLSEGSARDGSRLGPRSDQTPQNLSRSVNSARPSSRKKEISAGSSCQAGSIARQRTSMSCFKDFRTQPDHKTERSSI
jgi:hypothetical protein